jgi:hypothetical protein
MQFISNFLHNLKAHRIRAVYQGQFNNSMLHRHYDPRYDGNQSNTYRISAHGSIKEGPILTSKKSKWRRRLLASVIVLILVITCTAIGAWIYRQRDYTSHFRFRKGELASVKETPIEMRSGSALSAFELTNDGSLKVFGFISVPTAGDGPFPALLLLGGLRTGKHVLDFVDGMNHTILIGLDYPYEGNKGKMGVGEFLLNVPDMRRAVMNTVPAVMLATDYLLSKEEVDADRITLIGGSIGALFAPAIAASDERITAVAILFGSADLQSLIAANVEMSQPFPTLAAWLGGTLISPLEPLKYTDRISPRPLFMLNGSDDPRTRRRIPKPSIGFHLAIYIYVTRSFKIKFVYYSKNGS